MRVDSALVPPGLISGAKMHTIIFENGNLYIIPTGSGPASILDYTKGLLHLRQNKDFLVNAAVTALINNYIKKIRETESKINSDTLEQWAVTKGAFKCSLEEIQNFRVTDKDTYVKIEVQASGKKMKFDGTILDKVDWLAMAQEIGKN